MTRVTVIGHIRENGREQIRALFHSVFGGNIRETLAVIFLRVGRAEVQAGTDAHAFSFSIRRRG
jgi:hypothetical protein